MTMRPKALHKQKSAKASADKINGSDKSKCVKMASIEQSRGFACLIFEAYREGVTGLRVVMHLQFVNMW